MARYHIRDRGYYGSDGTSWFHIDTPDHGEPAQRLDIVHVFTDAELDQLAGDLVDLAESCYADHAAYRSAVLDRLRGTAAHGRPGAAAPDDGT